MTRNRNIFNARKAERYSDIDKLIDDELTRVSQSTEYMARKVQQDFRRGLLFVIGLVLALILLLLFG